MTLTDGWAWANGEWGMGIFLPPDVPEEEVKILLEMKKRVPQNVRIWMCERSRHSKPIFGGSGRVFNPSEVIAQCPTKGCNRRFRLTLKNREKFCPECGQALNWGHFGMNDQEGEQA